MRLFPTRHFLGNGLLRSALSCALLAMVLLGLYACAPAEKPIKIGAIVSLSGAGSHLSAFRDGLLLAVEDLNSSGGINGRPVKLLIEDSRSTPEGGEEAFHRLEKEQPLFYIVTLSAVAVKVAELAEAAKVPLIASTTAVSHITHNREWIFRYWGTVEDEIPPIVAILNKNQIKKLGILYLNEPYGKALNSKLTAVYAKEGMRVTSLPLDKKQNDCSGELQQLHDTEAIYVGGYVGQAQMVFGQARKNGYQGRLLSASGGSAPAVRTMAEGEGAYVASPLIYNRDYPYARELSRKYAAKFNTPLTHFAAAAHDILQLVPQLLNGQEVSRESLKKMLEQGYSFPGAMGDILVPKESHEINFKLYPARIQEGELQYLGLIL